MKKKKLIIIIITVIAFLCLFWWAFGGIIKFFMPGQKEKAVKVAKEYVEKKFQQEMTYLGVQRIFPDTVGYNVYFAPDSNADIEFIVMISEDFSISSDNYFQLYFENELSKVFEENVKAIWGSKADIYTSNSNMSIGHYKKLDIPNLSENTKLEDIKQYLKEYYFSIQTKRIYSSENSIVEAERIYNMIKILQESDYEPDEILFWYLDSNDKDESIYLRFENWEEITNVEQVKENVDYEWIS